MTHLNHVDAVLVEMIKAWPTLRGSRLDCLHAIATKSTKYGEARWNEDGSLGIDNSGENVRFPEKTEDEDEEVIRCRAAIAEGEAPQWKEQQLSSKLLFLRAQAVKENFNRANAEHIILAGNSYDPDFKDYPNAPGWENTLPSGGYDLLENVPENADKAWVQAFIELMEEVLRFKYPEHKWDGMAKDYAQRYRDNLVRAQDEARAILVRLKGTDQEKVKLARTTVQKQIDALIECAAGLGVAVEATIK